VRIELAISNCRHFPLLNSKISRNIRVDAFRNYLCKEDFHNEIKKHFIGNVAEKDKAPFHHNDFGSAPALAAYLRFDGWFRTSSKFKE